MDLPPVETRAVVTPIHGRVLVRRTRGAARGVLVGFHGYTENAAIQMKRMETIPGADRWTLVAVQALHRFYRGRSHDVIASWMTREDRDDAIADNIGYVDNALRGIERPASALIVYAGFSQGVAMAYRAALRGAARAAAIVAVGGDVPPELLQDQSLTFPPVFLARGALDALYTTEKHDADIGALRSRGAGVYPHVYEAAHEWPPALNLAIGAWLARR